MTVPDRIPIMYEPGDHTGSIGTFQHGLFLGAILLARPPASAAGAPPTPAAGRWYAALHLFDHDGRHGSSQV
jgi:hypothetical protein